MNPAKVIIEQLVFGKEGSGDSSGAVNSVNGQTGIVNLNSDEIPEGSTNLYVDGDEIKQGDNISLLNNDVGFTTIGLTGTLSNLNTTDQSALVAAINEVKQTADSASGQLTFQGEYADYASLQNDIPDGSGQNGWTAIVTANENRSSNKTYHIYSGASDAWLFAASYDFVADATGSVKGVVRLSGDLGGTANTPTVEQVGGETATAIADAVAKAHNHTNKAVLDLLADNSGQLEYDGNIVGVSSGASNIPDWQPSTSYSTNQVVNDPADDIIYRATSNFTSDSSDISNDISAGNLELIGGSGGSGATIDDTTVSTTTTYSSDKIETLINDVDELVRYADKSSFPATGETNKLYIAEDSGITYFWDSANSEYVKTSSTTIASGNASSIYEQGVGDGDTIDITLSNGIEVVVTAEKFVAGSQNVVTTISTFDSSDNSEFNYDSVEFEFTSSVAQLDTTRNLGQTSQGNSTNGEVWQSDKIDTTKYQIIDSVVIG